MGVLSYSPLAGGWLSGRYRQDVTQGPTSAARQSLANRFDLDLPENQRKLEGAGQLAQLADDASLSLIELAIAFVLRHPAVTSAIIGPRTMEHLESQLTATDVHLTDDVLDRIDQIVAPGLTLNPADNGWASPRPQPGRPPPLTARVLGSTAWTAQGRAPAIRTDLPQGRAHAGMRYAGATGRPVGARRNQEWDAKGCSDRVRRRGAFHADAHTYPSPATTPERNELPWRSTARRAAAMGATSGSADRPLGSAELGTSVRCRSRVDVGATGVMPVPSWGAGVLLRCYLGSARYSASVTCSPHSVSPLMMDRWVMKWLGAVPCQCHSPPGV
jgi:hypothetical protein